MKIALFIGTLTTGGAERQMSVLARGMAEQGHTIKVITLFPGGQISRELNHISGVKLVSLWSQKSRNFIVRLIQLGVAPLILRRLIGSADCLYSMLEVTNFIAWLATRFNNNTRLIWGIRSSNMEAHWKMALFDKLCASISPSIMLLIANSHAGLECLLLRGYRPKNHIVISNGIDTERFQRSEASRRRIRLELGLSINQPLVGIVGRLDPMKDHPTFLKAAALVAKEVDDIRFLCVGGGADDYVKALHALAEELKIADRLIWLGDQSDLVPIYSALDIIVSSSSYGEGFSNVIGEAMSCRLLCVVTDVGDSARIVGDSSRIVEPGNPEMLAQTICNTLQVDPLANVAVESRVRIEQEFSVKRLVDLTEQNLREIITVD